MVMAKDGPDETEGNDRQNEKWPNPACEYPDKRQVDPQETECVSVGRFAQESGFLFGQSRQSVGNPVFACDHGKNSVFKLDSDLLRVRGIILRNVSGYGDNPVTVLPAHRREPEARRNGHDVRQGNMSSCHRPKTGAIQEIRGQFGFGQPHDDFRGSGPYGKPGCHDSVQPAPQFCAYRVDREAEGTTLRGQVEDEFFLVIGKIVLQPRYRGKAEKRLLHGLGGRLQGLRVAAPEVHGQRVTARSGPPAPEAESLQQWMPPDLFLQGGHEGKRSIGPGIGVDQLDGY